MVGFSSFAFTQKDSIYDFTYRLEDTSCITQIHLSRKHFTLSKLHLERFDNLKSVTLSYQINWQKTFEVLACVQQLEEVTIYDAQLTSYPYGLEKLKSLKRLSIHGNQISEIPEELKELKNLDYLNLSDNKISKLGFDLSALQMLKNLDLSRNDLMEIEISSELKYLESFNLNSNHFSEIPKYLLSGGQLKEVRVSKNNLTQLPPALFENEHLKVLQLKGNQLTDWPMASYKCQKLEYLNISQNQLNDQIDLNGLEKLKSLKLSGNKVSAINLKDCHSLIELNFSDNQFIQMPQLDHLSELEKLDISFNKISDISQIESLNSLVYFFAIQNDISSLTLNTQELTALRLISLNDNQIQYLDIDFSFLTELEEIQLRSNQLVKILFSSKQSKLKEIDLGHNLFDQIPNSIFSLTSLEKLDMSYNNIKELPSEIFKLGLSQLECQHCELSKWTQIKGNSSLKGLFLGHNELVSVDLSLLTLLEEVELSNNPLSGVMLEHSEKIKQIDLSNTNLSQEKLLELKQKFGEAIICEERNE